MAAQAKAKTTQNGAGKKPKPAQPAPSSGTSTPVTTAAPALPADPAAYGHGKPEKSVYDAEQDKIKADIDAAQKKLNAVRDKLGMGNKGGPAQERRNEIIEELKTIRNDQGNIKQSRTKIHEQLDALNEQIQKKIKDLNAQKAKLSFKSVADVDAAINKLEKQVESGNMKVADEKRALADISQFKRSRRIVEGFAAEQAGIDADRAAAADLHKQLDDPQAKAMAERYDALQTELNALRAAGDEAHAARGKLLDERTALQAALDALYAAKRESAARFREANDRYWARVNEERARRAERLRAQRAEEDERKRREVAERLREDADVPAFQAQIEDCQTLIDVFAGRAGHARLSTDDKAAKAAAVAGVPELELRKVEAGPSDGMVVRKKKGEDEDAYFVGGGGKKKGGRKHAHAKAAPAATAAPAADDAAANGDAPAAAATAAVHVPMATLSALLALSIPPPASTADLPRVVANLQEKKAWFEANQARVTAENKAKAEREIARLTRGEKPAGAEAEADAVEAEAEVAEVAGKEGEELTPPNGGGERPAEPAPTPAVDGGAASVSVPVPEAAVEEKLESVQEDAAAAAVEAEP